MYYIVSRSNFIVKHIEKKKKHDKLKLYHGFAEVVSAERSKNEISKSNKTKEGQENLSSDSFQHQEDQCISKGHERRDQIMIQGLYAIKDELSGYAAPIAIKSDDLAKRWFMNQVNNSTMMKDSPKDFSLWKIGEFNTETGLVVGEALNELKLIERAESVAKND